MKNNLCCAAVLIILLAGGLASAQEFRATVTGRVLDPSQAAVAGCAVQVRNVDTNEVSSATSDAGGNYTVPFLRPGKYTVTAEATGFKRFTREGLVLNVGQNLTLNITLELGAVTEQVTVTAETPLLDTVRADRGGVIDYLKVHELPLNGRNPFMLGAMVAGVNFHGAAIWQRPFDNGAIAEWTINGSQSRSTEFLLDGAPNNAHNDTVGNNIAYVPPVDSVQEFKIMTNTYDAQYGKAGGGIVNVSMKSGGNDFHGTVYEFMRRKAWDANAYQYNAVGRARPAHLLDQYGFQASGPIIVPKVFNGRDKLFFMANYEGYREVWPQGRFLSVPTPEFLDGDFSRLRNPQGQQIVIYDPTTGRQEGNAWVRSPFAGNIIPRERIHPVARNILGYQPKPNTTSPGVDYSINNHFFDTSATDDFYQLVFKFDANLGNKNRVFFRHGSNDRQEHRNENGVTGPGECCQLPFERTNDHNTFDWVRTLSPTFIMNVRASYNRFIQKGYSALTQGFDMTKLGWSADLVRQLPHGAFFGRYDFDNYNRLGRYPSRDISNTYAIHPSASLMRGPHNLKFGLDYRFVQFNLQQTNDIFWIRSGRHYTQRDFAQADPLSGNSLATFLIGGALDFTQNDNSRVIVQPFRTYGHPYYALYVQDDWKATPKLTFNLGLRWDINPDADERHNRLNRGFDFTAESPIDRLINRSQFPGVPQLKGGLLFAGVDGLSRRAVNLDKNNIQPRLGFAYQLTNRMVVRGGWGVYYIYPTNRDLQFFGFAQVTPLVASLDGNRTFRSDLLNNPYPTGIQQPPGASLGLNTFLGQNIEVHNPDFRMPYVHQFSLGFQFQLPANSMVEVSYVGSRTRDLESQRNLNDLSPEARRLCNSLEGGRASFCNENVPNPFRGLEPFRGTGLFTNATVQRFQLLRPYPQFGNITQFGLNTGAIWYNSLQIQHETRFRAGVSVLSSYTFSKQIEQWSYTDHAREVVQRGPYLWDRPHRVTLAGVWQLPFGTGKRFANTTHGFWGRVVSGWELTSFFQWDSGRPWELPGNVIPLKDSKLGVDNWIQHQVYGVRPCVGQVNPENASVSLVGRADTHQRFGCSLSDLNFLINPQYAPRVTPLRHGQIRMHSAPNIDFSINKTTKITEGTSIQFRAEAFNVTNTYYWGRNYFINNPNDTNFGSFFPHTATDQNRYPRFIQLAVKFLW